jgi:hypothetical protein
VLERAFDSIAPRVMASASEGARTLLERAQAEIRDARLDPPLRELAGQAGELLGLKDFLLGIRTELEQGELLGTGRSAVLAALEATYPGIAS